MEATKFEKSAVSAEKYSGDNKTFYILSNLDNTTATWSDGVSLVVTIVGNITVDNIKSMIDSIGE